MRNPICLIALLLIVISGCKKDATLQPKDYPIVLTREPVRIDSTGVTLGADVTFFKDLPIIDFGFIWYNSHNEYQYSLHDQGGTLENFTMRLNGDLIYGDSYQCKAYLQTEDHLISGNEVSFISLGSTPPVLMKYLPDSAFDGEEVMLIGKYFSPIPGKNEVKINDRYVTLLSASADTLTIVLPKTPFQGDATVEVILNGRSTTSSKKIHILGPEIHSLSVEQSQSGTYIQVKGSNFVRSGNNLQLFFENRQAEIIDTSDKVLGVIVTPATYELFEDHEMEIRVENGEKTYYYSKPFNVLTSWKEQSAPPFYGGSASNTVARNGKGYYLNMYAKKLYEYNPLSDSWQMISNYPGETLEKEITLIFDDCIMFMGEDVWQYTFSTGEWAQKDDLPFRYFTTTNFRLDGLDYIVTNYGEVWTYDHETDSFNKLNYFPAGFLYFATSFVADGVAYLSTTNNDWQYDKNNDQWLDLGATNLEGESGGSTDFAYRNTGYVLYYGKDLYRWDIQRRRWIYCAQFPISSGNPLYKAAFAIDDKAYFLIPNGTYSVNPALVSYSEP